MFDVYVVIRRIRLLTRIRPPFSSASTIPVKENGKTLGEDRLWLSARLDILKLQVAELSHWHQLLALSAREPGRQPRLSAVLSDSLQPAQGSTQVGI
jgi:hypothetical protein